MAQVKVQFSGSVVAEPERKQLGNHDALQFPVYVNHSKKVNGEYVDSGDVTKIRVTLWGEMAGEDVRLNDIVEIDGTLVEKEFDKKDGTKGRALQTEFVNSIVRKYRKPEGQQSSGGSEQRGFGGGAPSGSKGF